MILNIELPLSSRAGFFQKYGSFDDITRKVEPPLLSPGEESTKIRPFYTFILKFDLPLLSRTEIFAKIS